MNSQHTNLTNVSVNSSIIQCNNNINTFFHKDKSICRCCNQKDVTHEIEIQTNKLRLLDSVFTADELNKINNPKALKYPIN